MPAYLACLNILTSGSKNSLNLYFIPKLDTRHSGFTTVSCPRKTTNYTSVWFSRFGQRKAVFFRHIYRSLWNRTAPIKPMTHCICSWIMGPALEVVNEAHIVGVDVCHGGVSLLTAPLKYLQQTVYPDAELLVKRKQQIWFDFFHCSLVDDS